MSERYTNANQKYKTDFDNQIERLDGKTKVQFTDIKADARKDRITADKSYQDNLDDLRSSGEEQKI